MNLVRAGHLHTPVATPALLAEADDCSTATVAHVHAAEPENGLVGDFVNVGVLDHEGLRIHGFTFVPVSEPIKAGDPRIEEEDEGRTFHLSGDCPWKR